MAFGMTIATDWLGRSLLVSTTVLVGSALWVDNAAAEGISPGGGTAGAPMLSVSTEGAPQADRGSAKSDADEGDPRPANYEFAFVSVAAYQTWAIAGRWLYLGAGGGLGPPLYRYSKVGSRDPGWDTSLEVAYANAFVRITPVPYVDVDLGPKIAITSELDQGRDPPQSAFSYGGVFDLRVGSPTIKVGPRFEYERVAYYNYYENAWRFTPLMVRVYH